MVKVWEPQGAHRSSLNFVERFHYPLLAVAFLLAAFASFWMSEHAVAAMCFPIVMGIVQAFRLEPLKSRFGQSFFLAMAWGCIIGGIATYLGGARNPLAAGILYQQTGIEISFFRLFSASLPIVVITLAIALVVLNKLFPAEDVDVDPARQQLARERECIGSLSDAKSILN